mmetsp:Transcript_22762/g.42585  ORF Transcript_22762/g.42585 Transcript_22762/m.42585 type:complete len:155 (+) Transcript_22762:3-467(+)
MLGNLDHSGLQIGDREYTFSNDGVVFHTPRQAGPDAKFKEAIELGDVRMPDVNAAVAALRTKFAPGTYHLTRQNCNHFTEALVQKLLARSIPGYVNRSARLGSTFAPKDTSAQTPTSKASVSKEKTLVTTKPKTERPQLSSKQQALLDKLKAKT